MNVLVREFNKYKENKFARNVGWMIFGQGSGFLLQAAYFVVLARLLGPLQYGIYSGAFAFTNLVANYSTVGMGMIFMRRVTKDHHHHAVYWGNILLTTALVGPTIVLILHLVAKSVLNPQSAALVLLAGVANCVFAPLTIETARVFQTYEQMRLTAMMNLLTNFLRAVAAVALLMTLRTASANQWAFTAMVLSGVSALISVLLVSTRFGWPKFRPAVPLKEAGEGIGYSFAGSTSQVYNDIDKTLLSHFGMNHATGVYTMAYRVLDIATIPIYAVRDAAMPRMFKLGHDGPAAGGRMAIELLKKTMPVSIAISVILYFTAPLIPRILGPGFLESQQALRWLCVIPIFRVVHQMTGTALAGAGLQPYRTAAQLIAGAFNFFVNLWLIPYTAAHMGTGWLGAAWSSIATDALLGILNWTFLKFVTAKAAKQALKNA
jgi:O-antigen/teichoic acid export membrane protein